MLTPPLDAYEIFSRARAAWVSQQYPAHLSYTIAVHVTERGVAKCKHYHLGFDAAMQTVSVNAVSDEELAAPVAPKGFTMHLQPRRQGRVLFDKIVGNPGEALDYLGIPKLAPVYSFGIISRTGSEQTDRSDALIAQIRSEFKDPMPADKAAYLPSHQVIANVVSRTHAYTIRLAGVEQRPDCGSCYHLILTPNGDPQRLRLREVWVDTQTFLTRGLIVASNFTGAASAVPWMVTFAERDGAVYISSETAQAPVCVDAHCYERATISFESIAPAVASTPMQSWFLTSRAVLAEP